MRTTTATLTTAAALLLALTACSSGSDDPADPAPSSPTATVEQPSTTPTNTPAADAASLERNVSMYTSLYFGGTDAGYAFLSKRCKGKISAEAYAAVVKQAAADYGPDHAATDVKAEVSGELARVSYKVKGLPKFDQQAQPWALEGDAWKYDAC